MKDSIILGTGNSRYLKSVENFKALYPTYDDFVTALVAGTLPFDFNGINPAGFQQVGDGLNAENLLKTATAALYGLPDTAVPDEIFDLLSKAVLFASGNFTDVNGSSTPVSGIESGSYSGTGSSTSKTIIFSKKPKLFFISNTTQTGNYSDIFIPLFFIALSDAKIGMALSFGNPVDVSAIKISWSGSSVTINKNDSGYGDYNKSGETYSYVGIS